MLQRSHVTRLHLNAIVQMSLYNKNTPARRAFAALLKAISRIFPSLTSEEKKEWEKIIEEKKKTLDD